MGTDCPFPYFLPDGRHFPFMAVSGQNAGLGVGSVDSPNVQSFMRIGVPIKPVFVAPNHLVFAQYSGIYTLQLNDSQVLKIAGLTAGNGIPGYSGDGRSATSHHHAYSGSYASA
jgi:hypothetical protein